MDRHLPDFYKVSAEVASALQVGRPVIALETTVVTHGLPYPQNIKLASDLEQIIRSEGAVPATIGVLHGRICIGMTSDELAELVEIPDLWKISRRDFGPIIANGKSGGTTVAGTLIAAGAAGIKVFATGGIGGVHWGVPFDVSADLPELSRTQMIVVCAGAKAILDLDSTMEFLETAGVPVLGFQTDELPAFYYRDSGLSVTMRVDSAEEAAAIAKAQWTLGLSTAVLVAVPPPEVFAMTKETALQAIDKALDEASKNGIRGKKVTPYLLARISELTGERSLTANLSLLHNNARIASRIAISLVNKKPIHLV